MNFDDKIKNIPNKYYPLLSFFATAIALYMGYSLSGMLSNGIYVFLRGDLGESHVPYIIDMCQSIRNGDSIWYSYNLSMGMNTALVLAYYTLSPFNILFLIFKDADPNILCALIVILKLSLSAVFFQLFLKKVFKSDNLWSIIMSVCYSMCGFSAVYGSYHVMWLDGFMALPLLCFLIDRSFEKNRFVALSLCYTYIFISQFYIGFMVGIFSFLFVILYLVYNYKKNTKELLLYFLKWTGAVVLAVLISALIWLPALLFLLNNNPPDATQFRELEATLLEIINSMFWGQYIDNIGRRSFSYSGILALIFVPLYFFDTRIRLKERLLSGFLLVFLMMCYVVPTLYALMHANDAPDYFWYRFSFLFSFVVCSLAARELKNIEFIPLKKVILMIICLVIFYIIEQRIETLENADYVANNVYNLLVNLAFMVGWIIIVFGYVRFSKNRGAIYVLALLLVMIETSTNLMMVLDNKTLETEFDNFEYIDKTSVNYINSMDKDFYRVIIKNDYNHNSDSQFGYHGIADFGSAENYNLRRTLSNMGFGTTPRMTMASGYNPVNEMILGVRYNVYGMYYHDFGYRKYSVSDLFQIQKNETALNVGYMVNDDILEYEFSNRNVFENLNSLATTMSGVDEKCFIKIPKDNIHYDYNDSLVYMMEDSGKYYYERNGENAKVTVNVDFAKDMDAYVQFEIQEPSIPHNSPEIKGGIINYVTMVDSSILSSASFQIQPITDGFQYSFGSNGESEYIYMFDNINYYYYVHGSVEKHFAELCKEQFEVTSYSNGHISGHINSTEQGKVLFLSIPYDRSWKCMLNGKKIDIQPVLGDAFMAISLPEEGTFDIELDYEVVGLKQGFVITSVGLVVCFIWFFVEKDYLLLAFLIKKENLNNTYEENKQ